MRRLRRPTAHIAGKLFALLDPLETFGETPGGRSLELGIQYRSQLLADQFEDGRPDLGALLS